MNGISILLIIFILLTLIVGGKIGFRAILGLATNFLIILIAITLLNWGFNFWIVSLITVSALIVLTIAPNSDDSKISDLSIKTTFIVVALILILITALQLGLHLGGWGEESLEDFEGFSTAIGIDVKRLSILVVTISVIGAVAEASMATTADLFELREDNPEIVSTNFLNASNKISTQILGTAITTLLFGMLGSNLPLIIWFKKVGLSLGQIVNSKILSIELTTMLLGMLGVVASIYLSSYFAYREFFEVKVSKE
ncbi:MAG: YibE/F family protein [Lactobacillaceae bacterium]|jgi:uncharacterized membrane protein|nr:YibE/F family protein [Lactobacillaceae bacterium]